MTLHPARAVTSRDVATRRPAVQKRRLAVIVASVSFATLALGRIAPAQSTATPARAVLASRTASRPRSTPMSPADSMRAILRQRARAAAGLSSSAAGAPTTAAHGAAASHTAKTTVKATPQAVAKASIIVAPVASQQTAPVAVPTAPVKTEPSDTNAALASNEPGATAATSLVDSAAYARLALPASPESVKPAATPGAAPVPAAVTARIAEVGFGTLRFDGLLQLWYAASNTPTPSTFRIRRAELKIAGNISPVVSWLMMFDVSKGLSLNASTSTVNGKQVVTEASVNQSSRLLQDAMLTLEPGHNLHIDAGQFRLPLGGIGSTGSSGLETVERPMFQSDRARGGTLGDVRDVGIMVRGSARTFADLWLGAFNGSGESMNTVDANNQKSLVGRFTMRTPVNGLRVGASGLRSGFHAGSPTRKDRLGAEAVYRRAALIVRAEVQDGKDGSINRLGSFVQVGYRATPRVQLVTRFDTWDPDTRKDADLASALTKDAMGGATWLLAGDNARLQFNVSHRWFAHRMANPINSLLVNLQASW